MTLEEMSQQIVLAARKNPAGWAGGGKDNALEGERDGTKFVDFDGFAKGQVYALFGVGNIV